jgi:hypothetical protein
MTNRNGISLLIKNYSGNGSDRIDPLNGGDSSPNKERIRIDNLCNDNLDKFI